MRSHTTLFERASFYTGVVTAIAYGVIFAAAGVAVTEIVAEDMHEKDTLAAIVGIAVGAFTIHKARKAIFD